jgi:hypothetical protein
MDWLSWGIGQVSSARGHTMSWGKGCNGQMNPLFLVSRLPLQCMTLWHLLIFSSNLFLNISLPVVCIRGGPQKPALAPRPLMIYCASPHVLGNNKCIYSLPDATFRKATAQNRDGDQWIILKWTGLLVKLIVRVAHGCKWLGSCPTTTLQTKKEMVK